MGEEFEEVVFDRDAGTISYAGQVGPVYGCRITVASGGTPRFGGHRKVRMAGMGDGFAFVIGVSPEHEERARAFAEIVNEAAREPRPEAMVPAGELTNYDRAVASAAALSFRTIRAT